MKKLYYILVLLTLAMAGPSAMAQAVTGGQFKVDGSTVTWAGQSTRPQPIAGDTISTTATGTNGYAVYVLNSGSFAGADGWIIETQTASSIVVSGSSYFSGSNLSVNADSHSAIGASVSGTGSMLNLFASTIETQGYGGNGLQANFGAIITGSNLSIITNGTNAGGVIANYEGSMVNLVSSTIKTMSQGAAGLRGGDYAGITGTNLFITTSGDAAAGAAGNVSLVSSTIETKGNDAYGLHAGSYENFITGSNLSISTSGDRAYGIRDDGGYGAILISSTIHTTGSDAHGIAMSHSWANTIITDCECILEHATAALVCAALWGSGDVTLINVTANTIGSGNIFLNDNSDGAWETTLNINQSNLTGNLLTNYNPNIVNLADSSTLTGKSTQNGISVLDVTIDATSQWTVTDISTLNDLDVTGTLSMTLSTTMLSDALMTLSGIATLGGTLELSASLDLLEIGNLFILIDAQSVSNDFERILFNGTEVTLSGGEFEWDDYLFAYAVTDTGLVTLEIIAIIPEPATWALILGGLGVLGYLQRMRRRA